MAAHFGEHLTGLCDKLVVPSYIRNYFEDDKTISWTRFLQNVVIERQVEIMCTSCIFKNSCRQIVDINENIS